MRIKVKSIIVTTILIVNLKILCSQDLKLKECWNYTLVDISNCIIKENRFNYEVICKLSDNAKIKELSQLKPYVSILYETVDIELITVVFGDRIKKNVENQLGIDSVSAINTVIYEIHGDKKVMILFVKHPKVFNLKKLERNLKKQKFVLDFQPLVAQE